MSSTRVCGEKNCVMLHVEAGYEAEGVPQSERSMEEVAFACWTEGGSAELCDVVNKLYQVRYYARTGQNHILDQISAPGLV